MASSPSLSGFGVHGLKYKDGKSKCKQVAKPILKKWSQVEKEKLSLDLDRGWDEAADQHESTQGWGGSLSTPFRSQAMATGSEAAAAAAARGGMAGTVGEAGLGGLGGTVGVQPYSHSRSISGTSHASAATSNSSNGMPAPRQAGATFVHPFQQTPRTSTPPLLSYANSAVSIANAREYSPTPITEDDDDDDDTAVNSPNPTTNHPYSGHSNNDDNNNHNSRISCSVYTHHAEPPKNSNALSQPAITLQRPPLATQRTSSSSYIPKVHSSNPQPQPLLRIKTSRTSPSIPTHPSRLANNSSGSDLYLEHIVDSPSSKSPIASLPSPTRTATPMSPLRHSLDGGVSRLRAKSDLDTLTRAEHVRAARRKFEMKERAKDDKYAREEIKRRERADNKRAHELEKQIAAQHKEQLAAKAREEAAELEQALQRGKHNRKVSVTSSGRPSLSIPRPSMSLGRPSMSRKNTGQAVESEKFMSSSHNSSDRRNPPTHGEEARTTSVPLTPPKRKYTAKKKTKGAWTAFILWLRTKLFRMGRH